MRGIASLPCKFYSFNKSQANGQTVKYQEYFLPRLSRTRAAGPAGPFSITSSFSALMPHRILTFVQHAAYQSDIHYIITWPAKQKCSLHTSNIISKASFCSYHSNGFVWIADVSWIFRSADEYLRIPMRSILFSKGH